ncbi:MAG: PD40 domain-containing protein [Chloroflexi bacterium]|nr:PD40 domain-containing protein [Chloroflexota bacterium]
MNKKIFLIILAVLIITACQQAAPAPNVGVAPVGPAASATSAAPAVSPQGVRTKKIIYSQCDGKCDQPEAAHVWTATADGGGAKKVFDRGYSPSFNPDGTKFVVSHAQDGLYVVDIDGGNAKKIVEGTGVTVPDWSHDGKLIAFAERQPRGGPAAAPPVKFIIPDPCIFVPSGLGLFGCPFTFARISGLARPLEQALNSYVKVVAPDGTGLRTVTVGDHPTWSPDDSEIAFDTCVGSTCGIYRIKITGGDPVRVTDDVGSVPHWSRDGKQILYQRDVDGTKHLFVVNVDSSGKKQLTSGKILHVDGSWSLEGNTIYLRSPVLGSWDLLVINADGSGLRKILGDVSPVAWADEKLSLSK